MTIDIEVLQTNLADKFVNTGWSDKFRYFIKSSEFTDLLLSLYQEAHDKKRFTPAMKDVFRCFELCPFKETKVVFVNHEPYDNPMLNNGLALSTLDVKATPGYTTMLQSAEFYSKGVETGDLSKWSRQGVLLLNSSLTTRIGNPGKHVLIWKPFVNYLFEILNRKKDLVWVFFGSLEYWDHIDNETHIKYHVSSLPDHRNDEWNHGEIFSKVNKSLVNKLIQEIIW